ncbi:Na+/H+ antiporter NhaA type [hydrothermal vent metagenome]|uniref:Na+/H+ antiporter NhaA type n=1 Tax=hydrothermal vent metagenome TaxID=652676 RepID=A0A3B0XIN8_9ZZZZ
MNHIEKFIQNESSSGIILIFTTILALLFSNTFMAPVYESFLHIPVEIRIGFLQIDKSLYHWINDGLMAIFFLLVGLEVKREILEGHLSSVKQIALPGIAAVGGMVVPAIVYLIFNRDNPIAVNGWAIPTATDIAFALGILSLLGKRVPVSLKIFLMALAIIDDLGAIVIIAIFYTNDLSISSIMVALGALAILIAFNYSGVTKKSIYFIVGLVLWISVLKSGVHATLAGVALAFTIPLTGKNKKQEVISPLKEIEDNLHLFVAFLVLPLFAFVNAGVNITDISFDQMAGPVPLGIMLGLFLGKQLGVFGFSWIAIKLKIATLPEGCNWNQFYGVSVLTGIGFTMSLFVVSLAFEDDSIFQYTDKLAILVGSVLSATVGYLLLRAGAKSTQPTDNKVTLPVEEDSFKQLDNLSLNPFFKSYPKDQAYFLEIDTQPMLKMIAMQKRIYLMLFVGVIFTGFNFYQQSGASFASTNQQSIVSSDQHPGAINVASINKIGCTTIDEKIGCGMFEKKIDGINFKTGSADLEEKSKIVLDGAARVLLKFSNIRIETQAHTDDQGKRAKNQGLSEARAKNVVDYLVSKGINHDRIQAKGYGESQPLVSNKTAEGRAINRRVVFHVL